MGKVKFATLHAGLLLRERGSNLDDDEVDMNQPDGHMGGDPCPSSEAPPATLVDEPATPPVEALPADTPPVDTPSVDTPPVDTPPVDTPSVAPTATPGHPPARTAVPLQPVAPASTDTGPAKAEPADAAPSSERPPATPNRGQSGRKVPPLAYGKIFGRRNRPPSAEASAPPASATETPAPETVMPKATSKPPSPPPSAEKPATPASTGSAPTLSLAGAREAVAAQLLKRRPRRSKSRRRAMTLRLDPDRHHKLRDVSERLHRSCQSILTEALDDFITVHARDLHQKKT